MRMGQKGLCCRKFTNAKNSQFTVIKIDTAKKRKLCFFVFFFTFVVFLLIFRYVSGKFRFGHSETVVPLMTALGLFKDDQPLRASNRLAMENRKFKTSDISPYSANVAFVLYACDDLSHSVTDASRTFMIQLQVNEKPMNIPGCDSLMCPYEQARKVYSNLIDRCDIENVCDPQPPPSRSSHVLVNIFLFVLLPVLGKCI